MADRSSAGSGTSASGTHTEDLTDLDVALDIQSLPLAELGEAMPAAQPLIPQGAATMGSQMWPGATVEPREFHDWQPAWPRQPGMGYFGGPGPPGPSMSAARPRVTHWEGPFLFRQSRGALSEDYHVHREELGRGGCSVMWKCESRRTGQLYACKSMPKAVLTPGFDITASLGTEIEVMGLLLGHPNIVELAGVYEDRSAVHVVMELCGGGALSDLIRGARAFREVEAAWLFRKIVGAVHFCHSQSPAIVHRNIAPHNILLSTRAIVEPKLSGFGRAAILSGGQLATGLAGDPEYMAPEMVCGAMYGTAADIWSLGVLLFNMLSGTLPFMGLTPVQIFSAILEGHLEFDRQPWPSISSSVKLLIRQMLAHDPRNRPLTRHLLQHPWLTSFGAAGDAPPVNSMPASPVSAALQARSSSLPRQYAHLPSAFPGSRQHLPAMYTNHQPGFSPLQYPMRTATGTVLPTMSAPYVPGAPVGGWPEAGMSTSSSSLPRLWPQSSLQSFGGRSLSRSSSQSTHSSPPLLSPLTLAGSSPNSELASGRFQGSYPSYQPILPSTLRAAAQLPNSIADIPPTSLSFPFPAHHPTLADPGQLPSLDAFSAMGAYHTSLDQATDAQMETQKVPYIPASMHSAQTLVRTGLTSSSMLPSTVAAVTDFPSPVPQRSPSASGTSGLTAETLSSPIGPQPTMPLKEVPGQVAEHDTTYDFLIDET